MNLNQNGNSKIKTQQYFQIHINRLMIQEKQVNTIISFENAVRPKSYEFWIQQNSQEMRHFLVRQCTKIKCKSVVAYFAALVFCFGTGVSHLDSFKDSFSFHFYSLL